MQSKKKILIAAGGTGGHLFPAEALAQELCQKGHEVLFCASGLANNRCFVKEEFSFVEIQSGPLKPQSLFKIVKGIRESFKILNDFKPDLVVGFGSYHTFPVLAAVALKKNPFILYESNAIPGKVIRLFSRWARCTCVSFASAVKYLRGSVEMIQMPLWRKEKEKTLCRQEAREYFGLSADLQTLLVFGGSQGALSINRHFLKTAEILKKSRDFQVIHLVGNRENCDTVKQHYAAIGITVCVKEFEHAMEYAWRAADLVVCRSGAATIFEQVFFEVPGILIPYPHAAEKHQEKNAQFVTHVIQGAKYILDSEVTTQSLCRAITECLEIDGQQLLKMKKALSAFKEKMPQKTLCSIVENML